jgi:hypothetical protein
MVLSPVRRGLSRKLCNNVGRIGAERPNEIDQLDDVEPSLASLDLGNERLRSRYATGQISLRQAHGLAQLDEVAREHAVIWRAPGRWHSDETCEVAAGLSDSPDCGLSHFGLIGSKAADDAASESERGHG